MPRKKEVNADKLIKAIQSGMPSKEIMTKFGLNTSAQLKCAYNDALVAKGLIVGITGRTSKGDPTGKNDKGIVVNKRGSLIIPKEMVEEMGFKLEDGFSVRKTKAGISLKKQ